MRLSADSNDPGYGPAYLVARVFLDGVEINNCITADEEKGECLCFAMDEGGRPLTAHEAYMTVVKRGVIKIMLHS